MNEGSRASLKATADLAATTLKRDQAQLAGQAVSQAVVDTDMADLRSKRALAVNDPVESREVLLSVLDGREQGAPRDIVLLNAGAAIYAANVADSLADGVERAREALSSGRAAERLLKFVQTTQALAA